MMSACNSSETPHDHRVEKARQTWLSAIQSELQAIQIPLGSAVAMVVFKQERIMEVYLQGQDEKWTYLKSIEICAASGDPGRKLVEGDKQVPEGFYEINVFNPKSRFHLSMGLNYPNEADLLVADREHPGGDIYIHGGCQSIGCCALTDEGIEPLYVLCDEARKAGSPAPKILILPCRFQDTSLEWQDASFSQWHSFWTELKQGYDWFKSSGRWPVMSIDPEGNYIFESERQ
jgi:murein L,D-transpeptidase YafK